MLTLSVNYCYLADRTQIFNKNQKQFSIEEFQFLILVVLLFGLASIRSSEDTTKPAWHTKEQISSQPALSRDQSDEWKGWMQLMILIYHYTGASRILSVYKPIRLLVASYLFLTGFGHTQYFLKTNDYSLRRFASVLLRLNLLSCVLPYLMRTDYMFYYFSPLVSFWFVVIYFTMRLGRSWNDHIVLLFCKLTCSAALITAIVKVPKILEMAFLSFKCIFRIDWDVIEWRFRVSLDLYIVYVGMFCGALFFKTSTRLREMGRISMKTEKRLAELFLMLLLYTVANLLVCWGALGKLSTKFEYNSWHPYISLFPVTSYVVLRNSNRYLRSHYCEIFAWLGRCSLETFVLQYHIWLAGDTKGLLSTGLFDWMGKSGRRLDFLLLTCVFLWMSTQTATAVGALTSWIIDPSKDRKDLEAEDNLATLDTGKLKSDLSPSAIGRVQSQSMQPHPAGFATDFTWVATGVPSKRMLTIGYESELGVNRFVGAVKGDLRIRLLLILVVLWILNLVCFLFSCDPVFGDRRHKLIHNRLIPERDRF